MSDFTAEQQLLIEAEETVDVITESNIHALERWNFSNETTGLKIFTYKEIQDATNGLSTKLGKGGFGSVYKGSLTDNTEVAIKVLDAESKQGMDEFEKELRILGNTRHPHLVRLLGACLEPLALVYEYLPNGSLHDCLKRRPEDLKWRMRTRIIFQLCSALLYLHSQKPERLVHKDVKPHNVLLDDNLCAKLGDFGLSSYVPQGPGGATVANHVTKNFQGTPWFIDPDYLDHGKIGPRCDVYGFGVTILIILTRLPAPDIIWRVYKAYTNKKLNAILDLAAGDWPDEVAEYLACFGLECCEPERKCSTLMEDISSGLEDILRRKLLRKNEKSRPQEHGSTSGSQASERKSIEILGIMKSLNSNLQEQNETLKPKEFTSEEIEGALGKSPERIGRGEYGIAYKAKLEGTEVAIKLLHTDSDQGPKMFRGEMDSLWDICHPHIVRLIGACWKTYSLVYEFLPNRNLEDCLKMRPKVLTWQMRARILFEICSALIFIHSGNSRIMVHGDLTPRNILLDVNFSSKLSGFGLSRYLPGASASDAYHYTRNIWGTEWYIDPEFMETGRITPGCDVYAFGITIMRVLTRLPASRILMKVQKACDKGRLMEIVDPNAGDWPDDVAEYLARMGLKCCDPETKCSGLLNEISSGLKPILDDHQCM